MKPLILSAFGIVLISQGVLAADTCTLAPAVIECGGVAITDKGCSAQCSTNTGEEALCHEAECHSLTVTGTLLDSLCNQEGTQCVTGKDGQQYVVNYSSCFCD